MDKSLELSLLDLDFKLLQSEIEETVSEHMEEMETIVRGFFESYGAVKGSDKRCDVDINIVYDDFFTSDCPETLDEIYQEFLNIPDKVNAIISTFKDRAFASCPF